MVSAFKRQNQLRIGIGIASRRRLPVGIEKVATSNQDGQTAFGIIDRDILLADPLFRDSLWWEIDNEVFTSAKPFGNSIFVLHHWELENYLLRPEALATVVADKKMAQSPSVSAAEIARLLIEHENNMAAVTLLSTVGAKRSVRKEAAEFGCEISGDELTENVQKRLAIESGDLEQERQRILAFAEGESHPIARWSKLSRMLDGKRITHRINRILSDGKFKIYLTDERGALAGHIANRKLIDPFLKDWLIEIYNKA